jgi:hypothetical protein
MEDGSLDILIMAEIALDRLTQEMGSRDTLLPPKFTGELLRGQGLD